MLRRLVIPLALALTACGGAAQEPASPSSVVDAAVEGADGERWCTQLLTARFVREAYGDLGHCRTVHGDGTAAFEGVRATAPRVTGDRASAQLTFEDGAGGKVLLRREDDAWRIDGYDDAFYAALVKFVFNDQVRLTAERPGLNRAGAAACVDDRLASHPPERVRDIGLAAVGAREQFEQTLQTTVLICLGDDRSGEGGRSYFRIHLERQLIDELGADAGCVRRQMRSVTDQEIVSHVGRDKNDPPPATERIGKLMERCLS